MLNRRTYETWHANENDRKEHVTTHHVNRSSR
jgi:hypothetical protein